MVSKRAIDAGEIASSGTLELTVPLLVDDEVEVMRVMLGLVLLEEDFELERSFLKNILWQYQSVKARREPRRGGYSYG
jgi:hypothetical protein